MRAEAEALVSATRREPQLRRERQPISLERQTRRDGHIGRGITLEAERAVDRGRGLHVVGGMQGGDPLARLACSTVSRKVNATATSTAPCGRASAPAPIATIDSPSVMITNRA